MQTLPAAWRGPAWRGPRSMSAQQTGAVTPPAWSCPRSQRSTRGSCSCPVANGQKSEERLLRSVVTENPWRMASGSTWTAGCHTGGSRCVRTSLGHSRHCIRKGILYRHS